MRQRANKINRMKRAVNKYRKIVDKLRRKGTTLLF